MPGDWDGAEAALAQAVDADGLADIEFLACYRGLLAALRGDTAAAEAALAGLADLRASEAPQDQALVSLVEGFTAAARRQPRPALGHARAALAHAGAWGSATRTCGGPGRWPPAPPTTFVIRPRPASCSPCSMNTSPDTWPRCCEPNATWPAPA